MGQSGPMTNAEFRVKREFLGLPMEWLATHWGINERTVRRWEAGTTPIPQHAADSMLDLEEDASNVVAEYLAELSKARVMQVEVLPAEGLFQSLHTGAIYPPSWHRAVVGRVANAAPGLRIVYADLSS